MADAIGVIGVTPRPSSLGRVKLESIRCETCSGVQGIPRLIERKQCRLIDPAPMHPTTTIVDGRSCGVCTLCCRLPEIDLFDKPANDWCTHCIKGKGCSIYPDRPSVCRDFLCLWRTDEALGEEWEPQMSGMMVYEQGPQITVLVAPENPEIWKSEPYLSQLRTWATEAELRGGYVIVFCQDDVFKI